MSFTDDNDHTTTITLCEICLNELRFKAGVEFEKFVNEGTHPEDDSEPSRKREYRIGDYVFLSISRKVVRIDTLKHVEAANQMKLIRPATGEEIEEYIETKKKQEEQS